MLKFVARRVILMIPTLIAISIVTFFLIQLPPGDFTTTLVASMAEQGETLEESRLDALRDRYGLDEPFYVQYFKWMGGVLQGDFGYSFTWNQPVSELVWDRVGYSFVLSVSSLVMIWAIAFPAGVYSAVRKYSMGDYIVTFFGFLGLAIPNFLIALVLMYVSFKYFGQSVGGLFSPEYVEAPWSLARLGDFLAHLWIPMVIVGTAGTASLIRITRANLLDELGRPYVVTARAKGLPEHRVLIKYPVRMALNPFVSTVGWVLPGLISGEVIISVVLSLPTTGPLLLRALTSQDMYLAGGFILILSVLTVIGTLVSDIMLAWLDPRIRYQYG
jgi:peptide/nickel transport system permease protein